MKSEGQGQLQASYRFKCYLDQHQGSCSVVIHQAFQEELQALEASNKTWYFRMVLGQLSAQPL